MEILLVSAESAESAVGQCRQAGLLQTGWSGIPAPWEGPAG